MATAAAIKGPKEFIFLWEGKDRAGKIIRGELRAVSETAVNATLRRQGILVQKVKKQKIRGGGRVTEKDLALFTRQLATMMKAGVPLLQAFKEVFRSSGADLPAPTLIVMAISDWFVSKWYIIFPVIIGGIYGFLQAWKRSLAVQVFMDRLMLRMPVFGDLVRKSTIARWTRTLATMFAAGVPLVEALDSVGGASGNYIYLMATKQIQAEVSTGTSLTVAMQNANVFPSMVLQMCSIGEETGALDGMLGKVADFYEAEVDDAVEALSSLMEPMIMVVLGTLIGGMVIAMYLPIFKIGQAV